jgi:hypothetical protein
VREQGRDEMGRQYLRVQESSSKEDVCTWRSLGDLLRAHYATQVVVSMMLRSNCIAQDIYEKMTHLSFTGV